MEKETWCDEYYVNRGRIKENPALDQGGICCYLACYHTSLIALGFRHVCFIHPLTQKRIRIMNEIVKVFESSELGNVRIIMRDGEPWFVAKDVLQALEYAESSAPAKILSTIPDIWKGVNPIHTPGGQQEMLCLSEQGLYFFLGRSDKSKALPYQMWIAGDVVPSIRKTGNYSVSIQPVLESPVDVTEKVLRAAGLTSNQIAIGMSNTYRRITGIDVLALSEMALPSPVQKQALTPTEIGQELGDVNPRQINKLLLDNGYQIKRVNGGYDPTEIGEPHALLLDTAKRHSDGTPVKQLKWYTSIIPIIKEWLA